jgi:hypothetical protein
MDSTTGRLRGNLLECMVLAALGGHDLDSWEADSESGLLGYEAVCRRCGLSTYASSVTMFSYLENQCPAAVQN